MSPARRYHVAVVGDHPLRGTAEEELRAGLGDAAVVVGSADAAGALASTPEDRDLAVVLLLPGDAHADREIAQLTTEAGRAALPRVLVVTDRAMHDDLHRAVDRGLVHVILGAPWPPHALVTEVRGQLARWLRRRNDAAPRLVGLDSGGHGAELPKSELLRDLELDDVAITDRLVGGIDRALGHRPRLRLPTATRLTRQDAPVDGVFIVLSGTVALDRSTSVGELRLHHASTGPVVGLLSLAHQRRAFFTAQATTTVEAVHLSIDQLDRALRADPEVAAALAAVSVRALAQRLRRSEQLQVAKIALNRELDAERRHLADALAQLEEARLELVESARFATLGELAAGVAHELNNPVAALTRAASYVGTDLEQLLAGHPRADILRPALAASRDRPPRSTADERAARRAVAEAIGDRDLAGHLVAAGIEDPATARSFASRFEEGDVALLEAATGLGAALRNLHVAGTRIAELATSLRAYARPVGEPIADVDVHTGIEDTLRLVAHRLRGIRIVRDYGTLPAIRCHPGQLDQVWTNVLVNAAESLEGAGTIRIVTDTPEPDLVRVRVEDDGPGFAPQVMARLFEPRFTTKRGTVRYGLGLGLAITKHVVDAHDGDIEVVSEPGRTVVTVVLPVAGPAGRSAQRSGADR